MIKISLVVLEEKIIKYINGRQTTHNDGRQHIHVAICHLSDSDDRKNLLQYGRSIKKKETGANCRNMGLKMNRNPHFSLKKVRISGKYVWDGRKK